MMKNKLFCFNFADYGVIIAKNERKGLVECFKFNDEQCEWEYFSDLDSASDWIFVPIEEWKYGLVIQE